MSSSPADLWRSFRGRRRFWLPAIILLALALAALLMLTRESSVVPIIYTLL